LPEKFLILVCDFWFFARQRRSGDLSGIDLKRAATADFRNSGFWRDSCYAIHMTYEAIDKQRLQQKLSRNVLDNSDSQSGIALVNVLGHDQFKQKHIPNSINIPVAELDRFEDMFGKEKEIVVYCASFDCEASSRAAEALSERGFSHVFDYEGGLADWEEGKLPMAGESAVANRTPS
jgi:rhodanese-related sulfurtransferase